MIGSRACALREWAGRRAVLVGVALALVGSAPVASPSGPPPPSLPDLLDRAGRYVSRLEEELAVVVADETYAQSLFVGRDSSARHRRSLVSDVAWVPTGDAFVWAFFRDVRQVDGDPVRDREERLEQLFPPGPPSGGGSAPCRSSRRAPATTSGGAAP